jgi:single-strand DNA-binding protein
MYPTSSPQDSAYLTAIGTASADAAIGMTKNGKPYARFTPRAEVAKETLWLSIIAFDAALVEAARPVRKGARIEAAGRLQVRTWTGTDGKERTSVGIVAAAIDLLSQPTEPEDDPYDGLPF